MSHVTDELELFALGALPPADSARVNEHLAACPACRAQSSELAAIVGALPDTVEPRDAPAGLRDRILASARAEAGARRPRPAAARWPALFRLRPSRLAFAGLATAVLLLVTLGVREVGDRRNAEGDRARMEAMVLKLSQSGPSWYMAGADEWKGSGGTFVSSPTDGKAVVLFHDLKPIPQDKVYALWLVSPDERWVRGANVKPDGRQLQLVDITAPVGGFDRCLVTLEDGPDGRRAGPVVMQSRIAPTGY